jgi:NADH-quinone oxidoreductase subunit N
MAGGSPEADASPGRVGHPEVVAVALLAAAATIFFGIVPSPLFDAARDIGTSLHSLL